MSNLRLACRTLFKTPFVTTVAVLSLALGIGANSGIFSLFNQILLRPLPVRAPEELVNLEAPGPKPGAQSCGQAGDCQAVFSHPMFRDLERAQTVFTGIAAHNSIGVNLAYQGRTRSGSAALVSVQSRPGCRREAHGLRQGRSARRGDRRPGAQREVQRGQGRRAADVRHALPAG